MQFASKIYMSHLDGFYHLSGQSHIKLQVKHVRGMPSRAWAFLRCNSRPIQLLIGSKFKAEAQAIVY